MMSETSPRPDLVRHVFKRACGSVEERLTPDGIGPRLFCAVLVWLFLMLLGLSAWAQTPGRDWGRITKLVPWWSLSTNGRPVVFGGNLYFYNNTKGAGTDSQPMVRWTTSDGQTWSKTLLSVPWSYKPATYVEFNGKLWAITSAATGEAALGPVGIWSSPDGITWTAPPSHPNLSVTDAAFVFNGRLYLVEHSLGTTGAALNSSFMTWSSADGTTWTPDSQQNPWGGITQGTTVMFNNKIWHLGGNDTNTGTCSKAVYSSVDGITWTPVGANLSDTWTNVGNAPAVCAYNGSLWALIGSDIWNSTNGQAWTCYGNGCPWGFRTGQALAVNNGKLWMFSEDIWNTPASSGQVGIVPIPDQTTTESASSTTFRGPTPEVIQGRGPITWSLVSGPAGMKLDTTNSPPSVVWDNPSTAAAPYTITQRATNPLGSRDFTWHLTVNAISIPTTLTAPAYATGGSFWFYLPYAPFASNFTVQLADTPDFANPLRTDTRSGVMSYSGLADGKRYYTRVRFNRASGLSGPWSNVASTLVDNFAPTGTIALDPKGSPLSLGAWVNLAGVKDPGTNPSGLYQMRFSVGIATFGDWVPFSPARVVYSYEPGVKTIVAEVSDRAGNITDFTVSANFSTMSGGGSLYVDGKNLTGMPYGTSTAPLRTIQEAIDQATSGTEVIVAPGTYAENLNLKGKLITLRSTDPLSPAVVKSTVIDGGAKGPVITLGGTETGQCVISGFTLTNGKDAIGGGIQGYQSKATIQNNRIINNVASFTSYETHWYPYVSVTITDMKYWGEGAAIANCDGLIQNNIIAFNRIVGPRPGSMPHRSYTNYYYIYAGEALYNCGGIIRNNTIWGNGSACSSALFDCKGQILNNIIYDNNTALYDSNYTSTTVQLGGTCAPPAYCAIEGWPGGGKGNLTADPRLVDPLNDDFHLKADSPCIDAGATAPGLAADFEGTPRGIKGVTTARGDGSGVDIGADEYQLPPTVAAPVITLAQGTDASSLKVTLQCATAGAAIRCTWGGNEPTAASPLYTGPLLLRGVPGSRITVKARAFKGGFNASPIATQTWTLPALTITQISRAGVVVDTLALGKRVYGDRAITFAAPVPSLYNGQLYLRTLNGDKAGGVGLSFTVDKPVTVYVALSAGFGTARPAWLAGWTAASNPLTTSDVVPGRKLYRKAFPAGRVTLGANREGTMPNGPSMYSVLVLPQ